MKSLTNFNLLDSESNLLILLIDEADVSLLLCILIFVDGGGVLEGKITSVLTGQIYTH